MVQKVSLITIKVFLQKQKTILSSEPYILGGQPDDDRIYVENRVERAPDYTEGEREYVFLQFSLVQTIFHSKITLITGGWCLS